MIAYLEAAYGILKEADQPLHYKEITERALAQNLIQPSGLTPDAIMSSRLYTDSKQELATTAQWWWMRVRARSTALWASLRSIKRVGEG